MGGRRLVVTAIAAFVALLIVAPAAQASFHEMSIREVYPGGSDNGSYVELQMWAAGQNFVSGHHLVAYNANGSVNEDFAFSGNVAHGDNQDTILVADSGYATVFPGKPAPDATDSNLNLDPAGGAVCWTDGSPPDCVSWGNFTGPFPAHVPSLTAGSPASPSGVTAGKALRRSIAAGCATLLELSDDTDSSVADFSEQTPNPRNNATAPTEATCSPPPPPPTAVIDTKPPSATNSTSASFTFHSNPAGVTSFQCKLDSGSYAACDSGSVSYPGPLSEANHTFQVLPEGGTTATSYTWKVDLTAPTVAIASHPSDPSSPNVSFTYTPSESVNSASYQCSLALGAVGDSFSSCPSSGKSYSNLVDGTYTFKVRATDTAGNQSVPVASDGACTTTTSGGTCTWTVDHLAADTTPPNTFIDNKPTDPSPSSSASFTYHADEPATFECKMDAAPFTACSSAGIAYTDLQNGSHTFQVRATDPSSNVDATPAGYTFNVAVPSSPPPGGGDGGGGGGGGQTPPQTLLSRKPAAKTHDRTPTFRFRAGAGATFQCKLDGGPYKTCRSPFTTKTLRFGRHTLKVRAIVGGLTDPTPATFTFRVVKR